MTALEPIMIVDCDYDDEEDEPKVVVIIITIDCFSGDANDFCW